jgi:hypothetical protein
MTEEKTNKYVPIQQGRMLVMALYGVAESG